MRRLVIVGGSLLVVAALVVLAVLRPWETRTDWSAYPGSPFYEPRQILAAPSLEERAVEMDAFHDDLRAAIDAEFEVVWIPPTTPPVVLENNTFGGKSMLSSRYSSTAMGAVTMTDPNAATRLAEIFHEVTTAYGGALFEHSNALDIYTANPEAATKFFGAPTGEPQATNRYSDKQASPIRGLDMRFSTYDSSVPVGDGYEPLSVRPELQETGATLFVSFFAGASGLLSEKDRAAFIEAVEPYDEREKPEPDFG